MYINELDEVIQYIRHCGSVVDLCDLITTQFIINNRIDIEFGPTLVFASLGKDENLVMQSDKNAMIAIAKVYLLYNCAGKVLVPVRVIESDDVVSNATIRKSRFKNIFSKFYGTNK